jgi:DNA-binding MarR family transcriptional regulator
MPNEVGEGAMVNLSSINHTNFARLHDITNNYNKATLLDKLVFWWQISTYTLDDGRIWFTRSLSQIADESKISKRSVERYLHDFEEAGFIEKTNRLYKKKNLYIRITEKLLALIGTTTNVKHIDPTKKVSKSEINQQKEPSGSLFLTQIGDTNSANLAVSIYKDQDNKSINNNTVSLPHIVNNIKINHQLPQNPRYPSYPIEKQIGERISEQFKNYIKGTMQNLKTQHQLVFSNPEQLFAEIVFSVLNVQNQFPGILDNHHRINLIAKLLREKQWRTPKGFYNHWDIGQTYKLKLEKLDQIQQKLKQEEINNHIRPFNESLNDAENLIDYQNRLNPISPEVNHYQLQATLKPLKSEYREFSLLIATETRYLNDMEAQYLKNPSVIIKQIINSTAIKLAKLHDKIIEINQQIHQHQEAA